MSTEPSVFSLIDLDIAIMERAARDREILGIRPDRSLPFARYKGRPELYAKEVLKVTWWSKQIEIARAICNHNKVFVKACHGIGKTMMAGGLVNWHFDCYDPGLTLTTAPNQQQVNDLTWGEVRTQRKGGGMQPKAPRIESYINGKIDPSHMAAGFTARDANAFQGSHAEHLLIIFEEAVGIQEQFWDAAIGMLSSGDDNRWLAIMNPTDTSSSAYQQELTGEWHVISISALDHPNIEAELWGRPKPFPRAVSLSWVEERIQKWCQPITQIEAKKTDIMWPPEDFCMAKGIVPQYYRPGPLFEGRVLGRWPSRAVESVWSDAMWEVATEPKPALHEKLTSHKPEGGCDVARFGDDETAMHFRAGPVSFHHERHNGWTTTQVAGRLKKLCNDIGDRFKTDPKKILVKIDDDGVGGGVTDQRGEYNFVGISAGSRAVEPEDYPNRRSELWFTTAERAEAGTLDFSLLDEDAKKELRRQYMAVKWKLNGAGQRVVEPKEDTKKRIKRSPDDADAVNLAYAVAKIVPVVAYGGGKQTSKWGGNR